MRGGEYVFEAIAELYPEAEVFTLLAVPQKISSAIRKHPIHTTWLQKVPGAAEKYRNFLPLMPSMIESFDLTDFDLVISSSHCVAKGIRKPKGAVHVSYVHAPMRYVWDRYEEYFGPGKASLPVRLAARAVRGYLQKWDRKVSGPGNVDHLIANSQFIADRIEECYGRKAQVIYPFADLSRFGGVRTAENFYLMVGAFAPYKRVDLAIEVFNQLKLPLIIVGSGQNEERLRALAGPTVQMVGQKTNEEIANLYSRCRAMIFPGVEDFGITPLEAMASGAPVIAFDAGGAKETVTAKTGIHFKTQTHESLSAAVLEMEANPGKFLESDCRERAAEFSKERFQRELLGAVNRFST
ncbi:MAG: glycosyltransferase [Methylotenera sp.]|nr:glycosyltransferase [Oligoflexia bacterium]